MIDIENTQAVQSEFDRLNRVATELLDLDLQDSPRDDHILAAEGLLALYEQTLNLQLSVAAANDIEINGEGTLQFFRLAAELHLKIAEAKR